jgi:Ca2+-binding RTX toxin-like protein
MATINGTSGGDSISPSGNSPGVTGGVPTSGPDTINGNAGNDTINGGGGNDSILGGSGSDSLLGGDGADTLLGGTEGDYLYGELGNDYLDGGAGPDFLYGNGGDDTLIGGAGDVLEGGDGNNVLVAPINDTITGSYSGGAGFDEIRATSGFLFFGSFSPSFNFGIERITQNGTQTLTIFGLDGAGAIANGNLLDFSGVSLIAGSAIVGDGTTDLAAGGNDTIRGSAVGDVLLGKGGNDSIEGNSANDTIYGGDGSANAAIDGSDTLDGGFGDGDIAVYAENISAAQFNVTSSANFTVTIGGLTDTLRNIELVRFANCILETATGDLIGTIASDTISGTSFDDTMRGFAGNDSVSGLEGNDSLFGGDGVDTLRGGAGDNALWGLNGADSLDGGAGNDQAIYKSDRSLATISGTAGQFTVTLGSFTDTLTSIETVNFNGAVYTFAELQSGITLGTSGADNITGTSGSDTIDGRAGGDTLTGGAGDDTFVNSSGFDTITDFVAGGTDDRINLSSIAPLSDFSKVIGLASQVGADTVIALGTNNVITLKNVTLANLTAADFVLAAPAANNPMNGTGGPDTITGTSGVDSITSGAGNDTLGGYGGNDTLVSGDNDDYLYGGVGDDLLDGGIGADVLVGEDGNDTMMAGAGDDYLYGGTGVNIMSGGDGIDVFISEGSSDIMNGGAGRGYFYRYAAGTSQTFGGSEIDEFVGGALASNDTVNGFDGSDYFYGGDGDDLLIGGNGNDVILGQNGNDTIDGGSGTNTIWANDTGNDQINVNVADVGNHVIEFFQAGGTDDTIRLIGSTMTSFAQYQALLANLGTNINGNALYDTGGGVQLYLNLGPSQTAVWVMGVSAYNMTAADFIFG